MTSKDSFSSSDSKNHKQLVLAKQEIKDNSIMSLDDKLSLLIYNNKNISNKDKKAIKNHPNEPNSFDNLNEKNFINTKNLSIKTIRKQTKNKFLTHHFFTLALLEYVCNLLNSRDRQAAEHQFEGKNNLLYFNTLPNIFYFLEQIYLPLH
ncbi:unnamed protein product [Brachionus calyciflorus]|uniref:Uncharacterized protein n=1 Tax=Brachionus calyciflorus TaxID=104777 RepID=A0A813S9V4_9BILA|nr:unnamed protein product [Brachionus calyciflorus]